MFIHTYTMEDKRIIEINEKVARLLANGRLKKAIDILGEDIEELQDWSLQTRFAQMRTSYMYLLEYLRSGAEDPEREKMRTTLMGECYMLNDLIAISRKAEHSLSVYFQHKRKYSNLSNITPLHNRLKENRANMAVTKMLPQDECKKVAEELQKEHEQILNELFATIWSSCAWEKGEKESIQALLEEEDTNINDRATLISAVTLCMLKCFEPAKLLLLLNMVYSNDMILSTRALIGSLLGIFMHNDRIKYYPELTLAIDELSNDVAIAKRIGTTQILLLRSRETQKIDRKMREEIIPAIMKNPNLHNEKIGMDILKEIEQDEDKNPEWKEWIEKDGIKGKIEEMTKWQIEGADVYMSTFSQLKNYPFFNDIMNWLRPFDTAVPAIADMLPREKALKNTMLGAICSSRFFCNSDKYSFCLTFKQVPQEQRDMLMQQITSEGDLSEQAPDTFTEVAREKEAEIMSNQYIQDLYRFFKLSSYRKEFTDPFTLSLNMLECDALMQISSSPETLLQTFEYLLDKEYYREAINAGKIYEKRGEPNEQFYQEMGYCMQKEKEYGNAIDYYTRADIIKPDSLWTLRHMAQCYRLSGETEKALSFYLLAEEIAPEDLSLLRQTGECMASMRRYDEAFARFFKVEYLQPGSINTLRAIAWCSFLTGKYTQAANYYEKIMETPKAKFSDYLNAGHVEWSLHRPKRAYELYKKAKEMCANDELFVSHMRKDLPTLRENGMNDDNFALLIDLLD